MGTVTKGKILRSDLSLWDGVNRTATRIDSTGGTVTGTTIGDVVDALQVYGSGTNYTLGTINTALSNIGTRDADLLLSTGTWSITDNLTIPANINLIIPAGAILSVSSGKTLTLSCSIQAGVYQIFSGDGTVTASNVRHSDGYVEWFGGGVGETAAANSTALQALIDSNFNVALMPGSYSYDTAITIDRAIEFYGAGSVEDNGQPGATTSKLNYTGTGIAISLVGTGANGQENYHLHDFTLVGTVNAVGGIAVGTTNFITKSSIKNVHIRGFTSTTANEGYGINFVKCLLSYFENLYTQVNNDGMVVNSGASNTTLKFMNCHSRSNLRYGVRFEGPIGSSQFFGLVCESNGDAGLYLNDSNITNLNFYSYYSEANMTDGISDPGAAEAAPVIIDAASGTGPTDINFYSPELHDGASQSMYGGSLDASTNPNVGTEVRYFDIQRGTRVSIYNPYMLFSKTGTGAQTMVAFMRVTANAIDCSIRHQDPYYTYEMVVGSTAADEFKINDAHYGTFTATMTAGSGTITLSTNTLFYEKRGRVVTIWGRVVVDSVSTPSGACSLASLPYVVWKSAGADVSRQGAVSVFADNLAASATTAIQARGVVGASQLQIDKFSSGSTANLAGDVQATTTFDIYAQYYTNA